MNADGSGQTNLTNTQLPPSRPLRAGEYVYRCGGRKATIVGDDGPDNEGHEPRRRDRSNGGKDTVLGRGGSDRICGGRGKDKLVGGAGPKDLCAGGKGKDRGKACEKGKL